MILPDDYPDDDPADLDWDDEAEAEPTDEEWNRWSPEARINHEPPGPTEDAEDDELDRIRTALADLFRPDAIDPWLERPNPAFGGAVPAEMVRRGETERIWRMIGQMETGTGG